MKRLIALFLSAVMILSMCISTFAEETEAAENKTTITATVANHDPSYSIFIPRATTITPDVTTPQEIEGGVMVCDFKYMDGKKVTCLPEGTDLKRSDGNDTIVTSYLYRTSGKEAPTPIEKFYAPCGVATAIYAQVEKSAWDAAPNGTYTATVTFIFSVEDGDINTTVGDIVKDTIPVIPTEETGDFAEGAWVEESGKHLYLWDMPEYGLSLELGKRYDWIHVFVSREVEPDGNGNYMLECGEGKFTFVTENNTLKSIIVENSLREGLFDGTYVAPTN